MMKYLILGLVFLFTPSIVASYSCDDDNVVLQAVKLNKLRQKLCDRKMLTLKEVNATRNYKTWE